MLQKHKENLSEYLEHVQASLVSDYSSIYDQTKPIIDDGELDRRTRDHLLWNLVRLQHDMLALRQTLKEHQRYLGVPRIES